MSWDNHYNTSGKTTITLFGCSHRQLVFWNFWNLLHGIFWEDADSNILLVVKLKFQHSLLQKDGNQHSVKASTFPWECYLCFMVVSEGYLIRFLKFSLSMHRLLNSSLEIFNLFFHIVFLIKVVILRRLLWWRRQQAWKELNLHGTV